MEKKIPHCSLQKVKSLIEAGKIRVLYNAVIGGRLMGFDETGIIKTVLDLTNSDFYKSMTTYSDHKIWQDVYHPSTQFGDIYLKITILDDVVVVSFKEL